MSCMLALLPFAITAHTITDFCCPSIILCVSETCSCWGMSAADRTKRKKKWITLMLFFSSCFHQKVSDWSIMPMMCVVRWWAGQDLVKMSFGGFCWGWQVSVGICVCVCGWERERDGASDLVKQGSQRDNIHKHSLKNSLSLWHTNTDAICFFNISVSLAH